MQSYYPQSDLKNVYKKHITSLLLLNYGSLFDGEVAESKVYVKTFLMTHEVKCILCWFPELGGGKPF